MAAKQYGGWYWNPSTKKADQFFGGSPGRGSSGGGGGGGSSGGGGAGSGSSSSIYHPPPPPPPQNNKDKFVQGTPANLMPIISQVSQKYGIPSAIISGLLKQESGFNPNAVSPAGARGIAQFMPATAKSFGINPLDPMQSIDAAGKYLRNSLNQFGGNMSHALASYNAGTGAVQQYGGVPPFQETQNYVKNILGMAGQAGSNAPSAMSGMTGNIPSGTTFGDSGTANVPLPEVGSSNFYDQAMAKLNDLQAKLSTTPQAQDASLLNKYSQAQQDPRFLAYLGKSSGGLTPNNSGVGVGSAAQNPNVQTPQSISDMIAHVLSSTGGSSQNTPPPPPPEVTDTGFGSPFNPLSNPAEDLRKQQQEKDKERAMYGITG